MEYFLQYGEGETVCVDLPPEVVWDYSHPRGEPVADAVAAVREALTSALNFPPLMQATVPGDRIAIALDRGIPQLPAVVAGVVETLLTGSATPRDISLIVSDPEDLHRDPLGRLAPDVRAAIDVTVHDPEDFASLTYLAASRDGNPIYFNRRIGDADVVIPIGVLRLDSSWGYVGVHGCLFPAFSDAATQQRFRTPRSDWRAQQRHGRREAEEAAWLLGVQFTIQVTPGPGDTILHVLAGDSHAVASRGRELCEAAWLHQAERRASLVVASIDGGDPEQTWENVTRALVVASQAVSDGGSIVLCTRLKQPPGQSVRRLAATHDADKFQRTLRRDASTDAFTARLLAQTLDRASVFLLSRLAEETVEDLGMGHVASADEITRLSRKHDSCILVGSAQHALVATGED
jgi:nickel-dependent lactate racemase